MKIVYAVAVAVLVVLVIGLGLEQNAYAAEKFVTNQTVTYQVVKWANDEHITNDDLEIILEEAILEWEMLNPGLNFESTRTNPDVVIRWGNFPDLGIAECEGVCTRSDTINYTIRLSIGAEDCLGEFAYMSREYIKQVTIHELGHTLGITHSWDKKNVMHGQLVYDGKILEPVGFNSYNIPKSTTSWWEGEEELWYNIFDSTQYLKYFNAQVTLYDSKLVMLENRETEFKVAFEENRLATRDVLTQMTVTTATQMLVYEKELAILELGLANLEERYEQHSELYEIWKNKFAIASAKLTAQEKITDNITETLSCFPFTDGEQVIKWVERFKSI